MVDDVVKTITIKGQTDGVDPATDSLNKLSDAMANVAVVSDTTTKSTVSVQSALDRQQRSLDVTYRSQQQYSSSQKIINQGLNEALISQDRANQLLDLAGQRFDKATSSATPFGAAIQGVQTQLVALAAGAGPVGVFLASFGPWGLAAAAGLGVVVNGFEALTNAADELAQKAQGLQTFSLITGLTTDQIQKLEEEGSKFGIQTDTVGKFLDQFSVKLTAAHTATGSYYDMVRQINPALAQQLLTTQGEAAQLVILAAAYAQAGEKGNALLQAAGGRGAVQVAPLLGKINAAGSVDSLSATPGISSAEVQQLIEEFNASATAADHIKTNIGAIAFNLGFLTNQKEARETIEAISAAVRDFSPSQAWNDYVAAFARMIGQGSVSAANYHPTPWPVIPVQSGPALDPAKGDQARDQIDQANILKATVAALGSAATAQDQYKVKIAEADIALAHHVLTQTEYNRVVASAGLDEAIQKETPRMAALGAPVSIDEIRENLKNIRTSEDDGHHDGNKFRAPAKTSLCAHRIRLGTLLAGRHDSKLRVEGDGSKIMAGCDRRPRQCLCA